MYLHHLSLSNNRRPLRCHQNHCGRYSGRLHACIGCMFIGCFSSQHIHMHSQQCRHWCAVDVERGFIYCFHCRDYVYHKEILALQEAASQPHLTSSPLTFAVRMRRASPTHPAWLCPRAVWCVDGAA